MPSRPLVTVLVDMEIPGDVFPASHCRDAGSIRNISLYSKPARLSNPFRSRWSRVVVQPGQNQNGSSSKNSFWRSGLPVNGKPARIKGWSRFRRRCRRPQVPVMPGNFPVEQHIFHLRAFADVVNDHVAPAHEAFLVDHHPNVRQAATQVPCDKITG